MLEACSLYITITEGPSFLVILQNELNEMIGFISMGDGNLSPSGGPYARLPARAIKKTLLSSKIDEISLKTNLP